VRCVGTKRLAIVLVVVALLSLGIAARGKPGKAPVEFRISPTIGVGAIGWVEELSILGSDAGWAGGSGWSISAQSTPRTRITFPDGASDQAWIYQINRLRLNPDRVKWVIYFATEEGDEYRVAGEEKNEPEPDKIHTSYDRETDTWDIEYIYGVWYKKDAQGMFKQQYNPESLSFHFKIQRMG